MVDSDFLKSYEAPLEGQPVQKSEPTVEDPGPGTELMRLLSNLGLQPASGCDCAARAAQMNQWGVSGCREHRVEIVAWLDEQKRKAGWLVTTFTILTTDVAVQP